MDPVQYKEALKTVQSKKVKESLMVIEFSYGSRLVLPYKDGLTILGALNFAESFEDSYSKPPNISYFDRSKLSISIMSAEEYQQYKIASLLKVPVNEIKEMDAQAE